MRSRVSETPCAAARQRSRVLAAMWRGAPIGRECRRYVERLLPAALSQRSLAERRGKPRCQRGPFPRHKSTNKQRRRNYFPSCLAERSLVEKWQTLRRSTTYRRTRRFLISVHAELPLRIGRQVRV